MIRTAGTIRHFPRQVLNRTLALVGVLVLGLAGCSGTVSGTPGMDHSASPDATGSASAANFNDADVQFAQMMIPHHTQAIEMSDMLLAKKDVNPEVVALAEQIKAAQQPEIDTMSDWLKAWGANTDGTDGMDHGDGNGMMTEDQMSALEQADGASGQRLFLEHMIEHHSGAIMMAEDEVANGQNPDAVALAKVIIESQQAEVKEMETLLDKL